MKCFLKKEKKERKEELEKGCMKIRVNLLPCLKNIITLTPIRLLHNTEITHVIQSKLKVDFAFFKFNRKRERKTKRILMYP